MMDELPDVLSTGVEMPPVMAKRSDVKVSQGAGD